MALEYRLKDVPGFEGVVFTESSGDFLVWPQAVKFAAERDAVLQSLREAAAFRIEAGGKKNSALNQVTRTVSVYFKDRGGNFYVAFDDSPDPGKNIILARAEEGYYFFNKINREWILPKKDKHIAQILKRAEKSGRIVEVVESPVGYLELLTKTEFGSDKTVQALLGDVADLYAGMLLNRFRHGKALVFVLTPGDLDGVVGRSKAVVQPVVLCSRDNYAVNWPVYCFKGVFDRGYARGVRGARKFSEVLVPRK